MRTRQPSRPFYRGLYPLALFWGLIIIAATSGMASDRANGVPIEVPNAGMSLRALEGPEKEQGIIRPGLMIKNQIKASITGPIVSLTVRQSFKNTGPAFVEGLYRFPLPDDASVHGFSIIVGDRLVKGVVKEKKRAEKDYITAVKAGKRAALLREHRPNIFSTIIGNIPPGETIDVRVELISLAALDQTEFRWRLPMAIMPRYQPPRGHQSTGTNDAVFLTSPDFYVLDGPLPDESPMLADFEATFHGAAAVTDISSNAGPFRRTKTGDRLQLRPKAGGIVQDQDFQLRWRARQGSRPEILTYREESETQTYIMSLIMPPKARLYEERSAPPRDILFILDSSGSMTGPAMAQASRGLKAALDTLRPRDRFDLIDFDSQFQAFNEGYTPATDSEVTRAKSWIDGLKADGGTAMAGPLRAALSTYPDDPGRRTQVIFLTDGAVTNEAALYAYVAKAIGQKRLFTIGVGPAPNGWFMRKAAEKGRGRFTLISDYSSVAGDIEDLMAEIAKPQLSDIQIHSDTGGEPSPNPDAAADIFPVVQPDIYGQRAHMLIYKAKSPGDTRTVAGVRPDGSAWRGEINPQAAMMGVGLEKIWARKKIEHLIDQKAIHGPSDPNRAAMVTVSLAHQVLSPETRFVAVDYEIVRAPTDPVAQEIVKSSLPKGAQASRLFAPQGALGLTSLWTTGAGFGIAGLMLLALGLIARRRGLVGR